jgi:hypothetical protein
MGDEISRENINTTLSDPKKEKNKCKKKGLFIRSIVGTRQPMDRLTIYIVRVRAIMRQIFRHRSIILPHRPKA